MTKSIRLRTVFRISLMNLIVVAMSIAMLTGCASKSPETPSSQRGWIGGEFTSVGTLPKEVKRKPHSAILVTALSSNTPAQFAGLREGDLILELDHKPASYVPEFHRTIYSMKPGTVVPVKFYRDGETLEQNVCVGRETYRKGGLFCMQLPPIFERLDLWPNPDFSLIVLGYQRQLRTVELDSVEQQYYRHHNPKGYDPKDYQWNAWLVLFEVWRQNHILSQEPVAIRADAGSAGKP